MIADETKLAFVQILSNGTVRGNGFLGPAGMIITCAHVVLDLDTSPLDPKPYPALTARFHWHTERPCLNLELRVGAWRKDDGTDIALLRSSDPMPAGTTPLGLASRRADHFAAELFPFIPELGASRVLLAKIDGRDEHGRLALIPEEALAGQWVERGVSGSPVFARDGELVEGIVTRNDNAVRQSFVCPAQSIQKLLDSLGPVMAPPLSSDYRTRKVASDPQADFLGPDPVMAEKAIPALAAQGAPLLAQMLKAAGGPQATHRLRKLCRAVGKDALSVLLDTIGHSVWYPGMAAARCFKVFPSPESDDGIYSLLKRDNIDVQRMAILAAGHSGFSSDIGSRLMRLAKHDDMFRDSFHINSYSFEKLSPYVVEALTRGFARCTNKDFADAVLLDHIRKFMQLCKTEQFKFRQDECASGLEDIGPAAADQLIKDWLPLPEGPFALLAMDAMAGLRLRRLSTPIAAYLGDSRDEIARSAGLCLGAIGCRIAAEALAAEMAKGTDTAGTEWALSMLYHHNIEWPLSEAGVLRLMDHGSERGDMMLVSAALRGHASAPEKARSRLHASDPVRRGASAIALAWLRPPDIHDILRGSEDEAASKIERILVLVAQLLARGAGSGQALHEALMAEPRAHRFWPFWRLHILAALRLSDLEPDYGRVWAEVFQDSGQTVQMQVDRLADRSRYNCQ